MGDVVIVDLDGTLLDTRARHYSIYANLVSQDGAHPLPLGEVWRARRSGASWKTILGRTFGKPPEAIDEAAFLSDLRDLIETDEMLALDRLQPGAAHALQRLDRHGLRAVLVTARRNPANLARQLEGFGLLRWLHEVIATQGRPKHTQLGNHAASTVGWIGDTEEDWNAARAIDTPAYLVTNGIRSPAALAALAPAKIVAGVGSAARLIVEARR